MKSQVPHLEYPFVLKTSPHVRLIEHFVQEEIEKFDCFSPSLKETYKSSHFGTLTADIFPNINLESIAPVSRFIILIFCFDDFCDQLSLHELKKACQKVIDILSGVSSEENDIEIFKQFENMRNEFYSIVNPFWMDRFINSCQTWFEGMCLEYEYNNEDTARYPSFEEYQYIREKIFGGEAICTVVEVIANFLIPDEIISHPYIKQLRRLVGSMGACYNDIHSVERELEKMESMNLVLVVQNERNCSLEEAREVAVKIHNNDLAQFLRLRQNLPDFGVYNEEVNRYVLNLEFLLKGQDVWYHKITKRYCKDKI
ncbi:terpene synthase family protein [Chryseobacterium sp. c4a]|uniref:terpene synthase family protein n=1 Tax=Chryseobacterium sp. c4a TaxID=1573582 RepID=UPI00135BE799|nr:terpene synthase family protein [Chryseobacterium sp. c4a]